MVKKVTKLEVVSDGFNDPKESLDGDVVAEVKPEDTAKVFKNIIDSIPEVKGKRKRCGSLLDKPVVCIGGQLIEVTSIKNTDLPFDVLKEQRGYRLANQMLYKGRVGRWNNSITPNLSLMEINWWVAKVSGVTIYLSNGSELIVQEGMGEEWYDEFDDGSHSPKSSSTLTIVGSQIHTEHLSVAKSSYVNNSSVRAKGHLVLNDTALLAVDINSKESANFHKSELVDTTIGLGEYININECRLQRVSLHGMHTVTLQKVNNGAEFNMSLYGLNLDLTIEDIYLQPAIIKSYGHRHIQPDGVGRSHHIYIKRRIDYGTFSARESVPFVRIGDDSILVNGILFTAKDLFPEHVVSRQIDNDSPVAVETRPWPPGRFSKYSSHDSESYYTRSIRGGDLFNRVANIVYGSYNENVIGRAGEILVQSLLEQIRSRVGLYVELKNIL